VNQCTINLGRKIDKKSKKQHKVKISTYAIQEYLKSDIERVLEAI